MDQNKSKPVTTSVPSIAIKFHANAEELEDFYPTSDDESGTDLLSTTSDQTPAHGSENDKSPLKLLPRLVKRSTSIDITPVNKTQTDGSPTSDPWRFFSDIKGKITKSVEEKIKSRNVEEGSPVKSAPAATNTTTATTTTNKKDSDSEDISQSESSISKTCGILSTTEEVEMSSDDDDTPSINPDDNTTKFSYDNINKCLNDNTEQQSNNSINDTKTLNTPNRSLRRRFKLKSSYGGVKTGTIPISGLSKLYNINTDKVEQALPELDEDVESAVEAVEDEISSKIANHVAKEFANVEIDDQNDIIVKEVQGTDIRNLNEKQTTFFAPIGFIDLREAKIVNSSSLHMKLFMLLAGFTFYWIIRLYSQYWAGFIIGALITRLIMYFNTLLTRKEVVPKIFSSTKRSHYEVPAAKEDTPLIKYEGWMNEFPSKYNPHTYHISLTQAVHIRLQGNLLRISHTKNKIPKKAMWNEPKFNTKFTKHRIYNLLNAHVELLPKGLTKKKHWSKKYPICITLQENQMNFEEEILSTTDSTSSVSLLPNDDADDQLFQTIDSFHNVESKESNAEREDTSATKLYLFARTHREKEDWFYRFELATHRGAGIKGEENEMEKSETVIIEDTNELNYLKYMAFYNKVVYVHMPKDYVKFPHPEFELHTFKILGDKMKIPAEEEKINNLYWVNLLSGRILYDCFRSNAFTSLVRERINKKLAAIRMPYFCDQLVCTELHLGTTPPIIENAKKPVLNDRGLWVDLDIRYEGDVYLIVQTKINLMKLRSPYKASSSSHSGEKLAMYESDMDDSAESSSDAEYDPPSLDSSGNPLPGVGGSSAGSKRFMRVVDRITDSRIFQRATEISYIKKAMEDFSNTDIKLRVDIKELYGTLSLNIPPPPTDRIWIGFQPLPVIELHARPCIGEKDISMIKISNWIEDKLLSEFQKVLVLPNMEDIVIPVMIPKVK